jgi:hypothetical protein
MNVPSAFHVISVRGAPVGGGPPNALEVMNVLTMVVGGKIVRQ